jgi:DNA modification methylase
MVSSALRTFSKVGQLVYDPFTGYGSIPFSCVSTGRDFIASEINPETSINASRQLRKAAYSPNFERSLTKRAADGGNAAPEFSNFE